jgi:hypothetical protein
MLVCKYIKYNFTCTKTPLAHNPLGSESISEKKSGLEHLPLSVPFNVENTLKLKIKINRFNILIHWDRKFIKLKTIDLSLSYREIIYPHNGISLIKIG